jgi:hypothetical protein
MTESNAKHGSIVSTEPEESRACHFSSQSFHLQHISLSLFSHNVSSPVNISPSPRYLLALWPISLSLQLFSCSPFHVYSLI